MERQSNFQTRALGMSKYGNSYVHNFPLLRSFNYEFIRKIEMTEVRLHNSKPFFMQIVVELNRVQMIVNCLNTGNGWEIAFVRPDRPTSCCPTLRHILTSEDDSESTGIVVR